MRYITQVGTYKDALAQLNPSDQLFESRDGAVTIRRYTPHQELITFFPDENIDPDILEFCRLARINPHQPLGRICRHFLRQTIGISANSEGDSKTKGRNGSNNTRTPKKSTKKPEDYFGLHIAQYVRAKIPSANAGDSSECDRFSKPHEGHWNYYYYRQLEKPTRAIYWDVEKAYFNALFQNPSLYFREPKHWVEDTQSLDKFVTSLVNSAEWTRKQYAEYWLNDGGALNRLKEWMPFIPAALRWQMLGIVGSHQFSFEKLVEGNPTTQVMSKIGWGGFFNTVQISVLWLWKVMHKLRTIAGEWAILAHTDGILIDAELPPDLEEKLFSTAQYYGLNLRAKEIGVSYFYSNINSGFVGRFNLKGVAEDIKRMMMSRGHNFKEPDITPEFWERWKHRLGRYRWTGANGSVLGYLVPNWEVQEGILIKNGGTFWSCNPLKGGSADCVDVTQEMVDKGIRKV